MPAGLFSVGDDVDAGGFLVGEREAHRVALAFFEQRAFEQPGRPEFFGLGEPGRLGQAAGNGGLEEQVKSSGVSPQVPRSEAAADVDLGTVAVADQLEAAPVGRAVSGDPVADLGRAVADGGQALVEEIDELVIVAVLEMADAFAVEGLVDLAPSGL